MDLRALTNLMQTMGGHDGLDLDKAGAGFAEDMARQREQLLIEAATLAAPFRGEPGRRCLEALVAKTVLRPLVPPLTGQTAEQIALYACQREGQNQIVAILMQAVAMDADAQALPERGVT